MLQILTYLSAKNSIAQLEDKHVENAMAKKYLGLCVCHWRWSKRRSPLRGDYTFRFRNCARVHLGPGNKRLAQGCVWISQSKKQHSYYKQDNSACVKCFQLGVVYLESSVLTNAQNQIFRDIRCSCCCCLRESLLYGMLQGKNLF